MDQVTIWHSAQRYEPELHRRCRPELRITNRSWRVDETDIGASGKRTRSGGAMLTLLPRRFFQKALRSSAHPGRE
jgi:transposase-like protein